MTQSFNLLDWAIFVTVFLSVLIGFFWGLLRTLVSALIWVLSFFVSMLAGPALSGVFGTIFGNGSMQLWLTYGAIFVGTLIISFVAKIVLRFMLTPNQIGFFDRLFGGGLGFIRGVLIVTTFLWFMALSGLSSVQGGMYQTSVLARWFQPYVVMMSSLFPGVAADIQAAGQQLNASPVSQGLGGLNPYNEMGPGTPGGFLENLPGMQNIWPWISNIWNMMMNELSHL
jgi:membrane protein required for colicin V production